MPSHVPTSLRRSALAPLDPRGRVAAVEGRLADAIAMGLFADGEQLPSEAELAAQLGVATVTLREALVGLRRAGLVETRRGRAGGTFVRAPGAEAGARLLERLAAASVDDLRDAADLHAATAAAAAALAAERASEPDLARLERHVEQLAAGDVIPEWRAADGRFHVELAAAARSLRLTRAIADAQAEVGALVWLVLGYAGAAPALAEHRDILAAVAAREPGRARALTARHVEREMAAVIAHRMAQDAPPPPSRRGAPPRARAQAVLVAAEDALGAVFEDLLALRARAAELVATADAAGRRLRRSDLEPLRELVHAHLAGAGPIAGSGVVFAPGELQDAPLWLEWWRRTADGAPTFLSASLDPRDPDFYDYVRAEWYTTPRDTGERWVAGPFVDHSGTDEHIFTLTLPVLAGRRFVGVAGADVAVRTVEGIVAPALAALAPDAALLNHRGRVIASNTPRRLVGTLWPQAETALAVRAQRLPWSVAVAADAPPPPQPSDPGPRGLAPRDGGG